MQAKRTLTLVYVDENLGGGHKGFSFLEGGSPSQGDFLV